MNNLIYFTSDMGAHNVPIEGYIATCPLSDWVYYSKPENMDKWDIINGVFTDITETDEYKTKKQEEAKVEIGTLHLTRGDVFRGLLMARGTTRTDLKTFISNMPEETTRTENCKRGSIYRF